MSLSTHHDKDEITITCQILFSFLMNTLSMMGYTMETRQRVEREREACGGHIVV